MSKRKSVIGVEGPIWIPFSTTPKALCLKKGYAGRCGLEVMVIAKRPSNHLILDYAPIKILHSFGAMVVHTTTLPGAGF